MRRLIDGRGEGFITLGEGAFLTDVDMDHVSTAAQVRALLSGAMTDGRLLGVTGAGSSLRIVPTVRRLEPDRAPVAGGTVIDGWSIRLSGRLRMLSPEGMARLALTPVVRRQGGMTELRLRSDTCAEDCIRRLYWVGDTTEGLLLIELRQVLNLSGISMRLGTEAWVPFTFVPHCLPGEDESELPVRLLWLEEKDEADTEE